MIAFVTDIGNGRGRADFEVILWSEMTEFAVEATRSA
jgi:hypothetical protein